MLPEEIFPACEALTKTTGLPAFDVLAHGVDGLIKVLEKQLDIHKRTHENN